MSNNQDNLITDKVNNAISILGDDHVLCIIASLRNGGMRFNELQRTLNINPTTLSNRLDKLESDEILTKERETLDKMSVVYELTKKGFAVIPIIDQIEKFAEKYS